ncbi:MAG TPA: hypothetical protein VNN18_08350 [Candidatus Xenobia bacterium]|nr:hypothetical protein [Candidatus Xenobia bacterium]
MRLRQVLRSWAGELAGVAAVALVLLALNLAGLGAVVENRFLTGVLAGSVTFFVVAFLVNFYLD